MEYHETPPGLAFRWQEQHGPKVSPPSRRRFDSQLIERVLAVELKGEVRITYDPMGIVCEIVAPASAEWEGGIQTRSRRTHAAYYTMARSSWQKPMELSQACAIRRTTPSREHDCY